MQRRAVIASRMARIKHSPSNAANQRATERVLFNALMATLDPGDKVIVPAPQRASCKRRGAHSTILSCRAHS
ncbi:MAG: hypothetical protein K8S22_18510 [Betaproteobacteria bacterium]|nr:hypothetical protein [Betaproteobacteria bacterium]